MEISNIIIPAFILLSPVLCAFAYYLSHKTQAQGVEKKLCYSLFLIQALAALLGLFRFENEVKMGFVLPFSADLSGHFDFSLSLHWSRFIWVICVSLCSLALVAQESEKLFESSQRGLRYLFLIGASFFSGMAILSENILLSILFIEVIFFLYHFDGLIRNSEEIELEKGAITRRATLILVGLTIILLLNCFSLLSNGAATLLCGILYIVAMIFSRHNFSDWCSLPIKAVKFAMVLFLLNRIMRNDLAPELWTATGIFFAVVSTFFSIFSLLTNRKKDTSFWILFSSIAYVFFQRFYSGQPFVSFWSGHDVVALLVAFSLALMARTSWADGTISKKISGSIIGMFYLAILSGAIPGVEAVSHDVERKYGFFEFFILSSVLFFIAIGVGRKIVLPEQKSDSELKPIIPFWAPTILVFFAQVSIIAFFAHISSSNNEDYFSVFSHADVQIYSSTMFLALVLGAACGVLLGLNKKYRAWLEKKERHLPEFLPGMKPGAVSVSETLIFSPEYAIQWILAKISVQCERATVAVERADGFLFSKKIQETTSRYMSYLSLSIRRVHSGSIRLYILIGILVTIVGSILFSVVSR